MPKLTKTIVDNAQPPAAGDAWLFDLEVPGFGVRIQASGRKTYVVRYRTATGTQRKMKIGRCCDLTPDEARGLARKAFAKVADGKDPKADRQADRDAPTMEDLRIRYMREWAQPFKKARSAAEDVGTWRRYIAPPLGTRKVAEVTRADVLKLHGSMADKPAAANAVVALLGKAFNLAEEWGMRPVNSNPCRRLKKYKLARRGLILSMEQIAAVDVACTELVAEGDITAPMAALARLWLITGCRNAEIRTAQRAWVDFNLKALLLPDSKVGWREIPLPDVALDIIRGLPDGKWLIPGRVTGQHLKSPWASWKRIAARAGVPPEATPHTLRHTVGSVGHRAAGLSQKQVAMQLGHQQMSTSERYIHGEGSELAQVANRVADVMTTGWKPVAKAEAVAA